MSNNQHHVGALMETVRAELDRAHHAVLAMDASEVRRGLQLALTAMHQAAGQVDTADANPIPAVASGKLAKALADLDDGSLAEMGALIEEVRAAVA